VGGLLEQALNRFVGSLGKVFVPGTDASKPARFEEADHFIYLPPQRVARARRGGGNGDHHSCRSPAAHGGGPPPAWRRRL